MDPHLFKHFTVSRGFRYRYFFSSAQDGKPTLLFAHGFPSHATDWVHQAVFFKAKGYGLIIPDQLGYGGTSKPTEVEHYAHSLLARDMAEIVDHESVPQVVSIGHDSGAQVVSRLANLYQDDKRYIGFGFLAVGYFPPDPESNYEKMKADMQAIVGYENIGYWAFFSEPDAPKVIKDHIDSFIDLLWPQDAPEAWKEHFVATGAARKFIEGDKRLERLRAITKLEYDAIKSSFLEGGFEGPVNYYKVMTSDVNRDDAKGIPKNKYTIRKPVIFLGAERDGVAVPKLWKPALDEFVPHLT
ncbi:Alpha/Beta hydrolase protein, partial [Coprinopsis sp. MPI-PUGE-AT-0042]